LSFAAFYLLPFFDSTNGILPGACLSQLSNGMPLVSAITPHDEANMSWSVYQDKIARGKRAIIAVVWKEAACGLDIGGNAEP
jgi:hypothetical protein